MAVDDMSRRRFELAMFCVPWSRWASYVTRAKHTSAKVDEAKQPTRTHRTTCAPAHVYVMSLAQTLHRPEPALKALRSRCPAWHDKVAPVCLPGCSWFVRCSRPHPTSRMFRISMSRCGQHRNHPQPCMAFPCCFPASAYTANTTTFFPISCLKPCFGSCPLPCAR
jgi:hypothetical protein